MKKLVTIAIALFIFNNVYSQVSMYNGFTDYRTLADTDFMNGLRGDKYKLKISDIRGTPYLIESFQKGEVIDSESNTKATTYLRFDAFNDVFEIQVDPYDEKLMKLDRTTQFEYMLNGEKFVLIKTDLINDDHYISGNGYAVELTLPESSAVLYKRYTKKFNPGKKSQNTYGNSIPPSINNEIFYLLKIDGKFVKADTHKKRILDAFPSDKRSTVENYIKSKKFKFRGSEDEVEDEMIQVVRYYNTLK